MKIIPAIDIQGGRVVQLVGGDPNNIAVEGGRPTTQARRWIDQGAEILHVVDLDAAMGKADQRNMVTALTRFGTPVQFGGGIRSLTTIQQCLDMGVRRVIIGTLGIQEPLWAQRAAELFPKKVIQAIDGRGREVAVKGWTEGSGKDVVEVAKQYSEFELGAFLYTNVSKEGQMQGTDVKLIEEVVAAAGSVPVIASGGIGSLADLDAVRDAGAWGVVLGMSIYTDAINFEEAVGRFR